MLLLANGDKIFYDKLIVAPGRKGFSFLQDVMNKLGVEYIDNTLDVGGQSRN